MQIIIVEPSLKDQSGHRFSYTIALQSELERRSISTVVLGNISAEPECLRIKNFYPCLNDIVSDVFNATATLASLYRIYQSIKLLRDQLDEFIVNQLNFKDSKGIIFFLHSPYVLELLSFSWFLKKRKDIFINNNHKVFMSFNFSYKRQSLFETSIFFFLYRYIFSWLIKGLECLIIYFSDAEIPSKDYAWLLKRPVSVLPVPINNEFLNNYINQAEKKTQREKIVISYVGGARYNKGFDILVNMLEQLVTQSNLNERIMLNIQLDIHRQQSKKDKKIILQAAKKLEDMAERHKNLKLIYGALPIDGYYNLLAESDVVILPYRSIPFKYVTSNIFIELIILGKIPIVSNDTTMSSELERYNLHDLVMKMNDINSLMYAIKNIVNNINTYKEKIKNLKKEWMVFYSAENLVDQMLALLS